MKMTIKANYQRPDAWVERIAAYDKILAGSQFIQNTIDVEEETDVELGTNSMSKTLWDEE